MKKIPGLKALLRVLPQIITALLTIRTTSKFVAIILTAGIIASSCTEKPIAEKTGEASKAVAEQNGEIIKFPANSPSLSLIKTKEVTVGRALVSVKAPSRVTAAMSGAVSAQSGIVLFESPDIASLYSQYRQTKLNINLYSQNLKRIKEMFDNHGATASDVNKAENDLAIAHTTLTETEARLRSAGFNPVELEHASSSAVWIISDVPESQLHEVQNGEEVDVVFNAFPEQKFTGRVSSIADVIDPVTRTVKVRTVLNNKKNKILPGMFATVDFGDPEDSVVKLNSEAVISVEGKDYCFVETERGIYERREIIVKVSGEDGVVVTKGLRAGDKAVIDGAILLKGISFGY